MRVCMGIRIQMQTRQPSCIFILSKSAFTGPDSALEGLLVYDALIRQCIQNGFVLLAVALLGLGFGNGCIRCGGGGGGGC